MNAIGKIRHKRMGNQAPCSEALEWLSDHPRWTIADAWQYCHRSDWMLWYLRASELAMIYPHEIKTLILESARRALVHCTSLGVSVDPRSWESVRIGLECLDSQVAWPDIDVNYSDTYDDIIIQGNSITVVYTDAYAYADIYSTRNTDGNAVAYAYAYAYAISLYSNSADVQKRRLQRRELKIQADRLRQLIEVEP